jgi:AAA domain
MVRRNQADENELPPWSMLWSKFYTNYADYLRARQRIRRELDIKRGVKPEDLEPLLEIPDWATPENFNPDEQPKRIDQPLGKPYGVVSAAELDAGNYQPRYLIPGILAAGEAGGIYGPTKSLKTSLAADLLISLASGTPFLGRFAVPEPGKVLFFSCRAGLAGMQSLARRICRERGVSLASLENLAFSSDPSVLERGVDLRAFRALLVREKPVCVVIDPAGLAVSGEKRRDPFALGDLMGPLGEMCRSLGCALLVVHHCKRSTKVGRPATLDDVAGAGFAEFSAQWLLVSRRRAYDPASGHHELWLSSGNGAGHQGLWALDVEEGSAPPLADEGPIVPVDPESRTWKTTLRSVAWAETQADEQAAQRKEERRQRYWAATYACHRKRVLKHLICYPEGRTANGIRDTLGLNGVRAKQILEQLIYEGRVETFEIEHGKRTDIFYRLAVKHDLSIRGMAPAGAAGAGSHGELEPAGSSDCCGAREKSGPGTLSTPLAETGEECSAAPGAAIPPAAPSPPTPLPQGERGEERAASQDAAEVPRAAEKSGPDTLAGGDTRADSVPPGDSES